MTKGKRLAIILIVIISVLAGVGYVFYSNTLAVPAEDSNTAEVQTTTVRRGDITVSATGAGTIIPAREINLSFTTSGTLDELLINVGAKVAAGDVLAKIDDTAAQKALANAQLQYAQAAMQTDATATQTGVSYDDISIAQARTAVDEAQQALDELRSWTVDPDEIALLQSKLDAAQASYNAARGQEASTATNISVRAISVDQAERDLATAQEAYDIAFDPAREWMFNDPQQSNALTAERDRATTSLQRAQEALEVARLNYNAAVSSTNSSSSSSAQSNLLSAQQALAAAQLGPTVEEIAAAEAALRQAELALQQAQLNQEAHGLSLAQAELNVTSAEADLAGTILYAPIDGTILAINSQVGEQVGGSIFLTLADLSQPMLEIFLDESDMDKAVVGYDVEVTFDALPDDLFTGQIVQVDPQLYQSGGVSAVRAVVQLNYNKPQTLPVGLNATVEVIGGRSLNALLVPVEALREISTGQYAVFVMENGQPKLRMVEVGLIDFTFAEIVSGLEAGETVTTGIVETQ